MKDLTGSTFGSLVVLRLARRGDYANGKSVPPRWLCRCACGTEKEVSDRDLRYAGVASCGKRACQPFRGTDLTGRVFERLSVARLHARGKRGGSPIWECRCQCGKTHLAKASDLLANDVKSCGCLKSGPTCESARRTHGQSNKKGRKREGKMGATPTYSTWRGVLDRCRNPNNIGYASYGGAGVTCCERWESFENFLADMGEKPGPEYSIDRIDNARGYEPGNCQWATRKTQNRNRSISVVIAHEGQTMTLVEWAELLDIPCPVLTVRLARGWTTERAFSQPYKPCPPTRRRTAREIWWNIKNRCHNPKDGDYHRYGGRGITMCLRWRDDVAEFVTDMGERPSDDHSVDRIDNERGYHCGKAECAECSAHDWTPNCRWATPKTQANNRRSTLFLECDGVRLSICEWAERLKVTTAAIHARLNKGVTPQEALTKPFKRS